MRSFYKNSFTPIYSTYIKNNKLLILENCIFFVRVDILKNGGWTADLLKPFEKKESQTVAQNSRLDIEQRNKQTNIKY